MLLKQSAELQLAIEPDPFSSVGLALDCGLNNL
jgi:hypothetical protein